MLHKDLREFVELLNLNNVEYVIVGAHAMAYHGCPRYTGDLDLLVRPSEENAERLIKTMQDFGFGSLDLTAHSFLEPQTVVQLGVAPNRIDLLTRLTGVDFEVAWEHREKTELDGLRVSMLSKDDLISNKRALGRPKDLADLELLDHRD